MLALVRTRTSTCVTGLLASVLLVACDNPAPGEAVDHSLMQKTEPTVMSGSQAVQSVDIPKTDLGTMVEAEFEELLPTGPRCTFAYTAESPPVLAAAVEADVQGVTKIHGHLVPLTAPETADFQALTSGGDFIAEGVRITVVPDAEAEWEVVADKAQRRQAELHFRLEQGLNVGYRGWYVCNE